ncbi:hypothetical protein XH97_19665 [Bradyrhizobium sp. CCBAU 53380]|nr:hypothetical protein [Bradyrhizobium sp. CCBAU 53380]
MPNFMASLSRLLIVKAILTCEAPLSTEQKFHGAENDPLSCVATHIRLDAALRHLCRPAA